MRFYAISNKGCVVTDDYTSSEIRSKKHIYNIIDDYKAFDYHGLIRVFDMNNRFVCKLKDGKILK